MALDQHFGIMVIEVYLNETLTFENYIGDGQAGIHIDSARIVHGESVSIMVQT